MKKLFGIVLALIMLITMVGCQNDMTTKAEYTVGVDSEEYDYVCVDIAKDSGYYSLMSKVKVDYYQGEIAGVHVEEPTLLAFKVPDKYTNGIGTIDGNEVIEMTNRINSYLDENETNEETQRLLSYILEQLDGIALLTEAST